MKKLKILISGGGTGGHIFPAISIANALKTKWEDTEILFIGAEGKMEMEKIPAAGYEIKGLPVIGLKRKISFSIFTFIFKTIKSLRLAKKIIKEFKPDVAVGVGGYASGPALKAAARLKIPYLLQEQNSYPGITNKLLAKKADKICVAYDNMDKFFPADKIIKTGNPIRADIKNIENKSSKAFKFFNLNPNTPTVLIIGGSLGAKTINDSIANTLEEYVNANIQVIWQTGKTYFETAKKIVDKINSDLIFVSDFIFKMEYAFAVADIIISRAGASSISELCVVGKPTILVPSPNVSEDHQTKNALALSTINAAILIKDSEAREKLTKQCLELLKDEEYRKVLAKNIKKLELVNSAEIIAEEIKKMANV
ncbi:MAG: undecaprenyldiphospho-muramoylpentapeptide beta-N-acetylglucosaminyltransferase [Bacteroidales bacterium]|jgi:UDP-N-acetylglucosamine--N-acetylmuramyl-(pentapeptide) pyrophosphoryl-undecaprenol N-acetylglucosamine transferase|nr:undecaprenyldiphospho-muramoylpentapeptide beta-N-acetylglucosaminyltransferase [Bacteroidales bacterium]MCK9500149.1 undecaprenyldiphospho-muramoylpentapeptide beta-N-acetylglucosaminyltransferase [Bacteroidales bacterium]MDY0315389.1 undecaprenyldiphospho-muramoylpentapeptide beta-N-acetylglucosaminyltransferase [Bacteroidales bacterium]NLB85668.1 undecaprenyldiphospho-muramoylpentapeptide beta-N-acetylglucosaminyltransferase [Bacteroidales bacterium]